MPVTPACPCAAVESTVASNRAHAYRPPVQDFRGYGGDSAGWLCATSSNEINAQAYEVKLMLSERTLAETATGSR